MQPYYQSLSPVSLSGKQLDQLLALGWYRMHQDVFTTSHVQLEDVYRVHWLRYPIESISQHSSHKRIRNRARNFKTTIGDFVINETYQLLHLQYYAHIDFDGAPSIVHGLFGMDYVIPSIYTTKTVSVYDGDRLIAAGYFDVGKKGAASILHFFDPAYRQYSLGKYLMLRTVDWLKENNFDYYYPGYIVEGNAKMDYKLFLGREDAEYFNPSVMEWRHVSEVLVQ